MIKRLLNKIKSYCSEYSPVSETNLLNCSNRFFNKIYFYKIVEVDVIETFVTPTFSIVPLT